MAANAHIPELDAKGLRDFGITTGAIVAVLFGLLLPWIFDAESYPIWPWVVFSTLALWGVAAPTTLRPVYTTWMRFGLLISKITTPLIMTLVFVLTIVPVALILKLIRWDAMSRKLDATVSTYRIESEKPSSDSLKRPF